MKGGVKLRQPEKTHKGGRLGEGFQVGDTEPIKARNRINTQTMRVDRTARRTWRSRAEALGKEPLAGRLLRSVLWLRIEPWKPVIQHQAKVTMAESFPVSGYKNTQCSTVYEGDQMVLNIMSGKFDESSIPEYEVSVRPSKFNAETPTNAKVLSAEEIVKLAGSRYTRGSPNSGMDSFFVTPAMMMEGQHGLELAHLLFNSAEFISSKQYDHSAGLLTQCRNFSLQWEAQYRGSPGVNRMPGLRGVEQTSKTSSQFRQQFQQWS
ncbi:hypothetical protein SUGI_0376010 [Cryptomeria japonica]|nr:hypothetical protein SUGI_0376010 [Cryptomeria japonica]